MDAVVSELIAAAPEHVAEIMFDFMWEPYWIPAVKSVEQASDHSEFVPGMRVKRWGKHPNLSDWIVEVVEHEPLRLVLRNFFDGSRAHEEVYEILLEGIGSRVSVHHRDLGGFPTRLLFRLAYRKNLKRLKAIVERQEVRRLAESVELPT